MRVQTTGTGWQWALHEDHRLKQITNGYRMLCRVLLMCTVSVFALSVHQVRISSYHCWVAVEVDCESHKYTWYKKWKICARIVLSLSEFTNHVCPVWSFVLHVLTLLRVREFFEFDSNVNIAVEDVTATFAEIEALTWASEPINPIMCAFCLIAGWSIPAFGKNFVLWIIWAIIMFRSFQAVICVVSPSLVNCLSILASAVLQLWQNNL